MRLSLAVNGGLLVTPQGVRPGSVGIADGRIVQITPDPPDAEEVIDARGRMVFPGAVDLHVHFNEPGRTEWEGWGPGSRAAAAGGVTTVVEMPLNALPPTTAADALAAKVAAAEDQSVVDFALWGGLVDDNREHLAALAAGGVIGFKAFMCESGTAEFRHVDDALLYDGLVRLASLGALLAVHAESQWIVKDRTERLRAAGRRDRRAWGESRPPVAELDAIARALLLAGRAGCRLHIVHLSLPEGAEAIAQAKAAGQAVTVETCAHYLTLTDDDLVALGPVAKCAPPLRDRATVERLWQDVLGGRIDCLTSDHSPCPTADKTKGDEDIFAAWGGISGVQTLVPLVLTEGVHRRGMPPEQCAALLAARPAQIAGLWPRKGALQVGADADLMIVELQREWTLQADQLQSRHRHSPFLGRRMRGWIERVLRRGETIARDGEITAAGGGRWLRPGETDGGPV